MMKKVSTLLLLLAGMVLGASANPIDRAEARLLAEECVGIDDTSDDTGPIAPYYIFSRGAGKGFVIVSGDDSTAPILGYTEQGDFVWDELPEQLQQMLKAWEQAIGETQKAPRRVGPRRSVSERLEAARRGVESFKEKWEDVPVMCQTHWHQTSPYNDICPMSEDGTKRAVTGCVATAASQIIYYFRKDNPAELQYNTPTYSYGFPVVESLPKGTPVEYDLMRLSGKGTAKQNHAVAVLMYAIGTSSYLTYGESTGGQPDECGKAMSGQFWLDNDYRGKWNYTQQQWENLIYKSLKAGSPMLYGATAKDKSGGHAVVLDGYQAKTGLFHFNFGWGGQGDGWYTVDDENGMNGFPYDQRGCMNFRPRKPNLKAEMKQDAFYHRATATIKAHVENNGTLDYSGFNFYVSTSSKMPSSPTKTDKETVVKVGESGDLEFTYRPTFQPSRYPELWLFLTDANKNILDSCRVEVKESKADLVLEHIGVDAGTMTSEVDGMTFGMVNNTTATVKARLTNGEDGTFCQPTVNCHLYVYDTEGKEWSEVTHQYASSDVFEKGDTRDVTFTFRSLEEGKYYKAFIDGKVTATDACELRYATADTAVCFTVRTADFVVEVTGRQATARGHWNSTIFENTPMDASVCSFDMTEVKELAEKPVATNPNAVFYVKEAVPGAWNMVVGEECDSLVVKAGNEFCPTQAFKARKATFVIENCEAGVWGDLFIPFTMELPYGMQGKRIMAVGSAAMTIEKSRLTGADAPIIYLTAHSGDAVLTGSNVVIGVDSLLSAADGELTAATVFTATDVRNMTLGFKGNVPYFMPVTESVVEPFRIVSQKYNASGLRAIAISDVSYPDLAKDIETATLLKAEHPEMAGTAALAAFEESIKKAEDAFTFSTPEKSSEVRQEIVDLEAAIEAFLTAVTTGIETPDVQTAAASGPAEYYSLSGVRLQGPERGIVIVKRGNQVRKVVVK